MEDVDIAMNDFMGKLVFPLEPYHNKAPQRSWYKLKNLKGVADAEKRGEIEVLIHWRWNKAIPRPKAISTSRHGSVLGFLGFGEVEDEEAEDEEVSEPRPHQHLLFHPFNTKLTKNIQFVFVLDGRIGENSSQDGGGNRQGASGEGGGERASTKTRVRATTKPTLFHSIPFRTFFARRRLKRNSWPSLETLKSNRATTRFRSTSLRFAI
jgi:hypothetical protein